mmetsp:Transcript_31168/g.66932  ORF Transcript_31168/g.66932 Transcript_31168/m.66932 type:complete len:102 (-) Transcript_31168:887-1192(-)
MLLDGIAIDGCNSPPCSNAWLQQSDVQQDGAVVQQALACTVSLISEIGWIPKSCRARGQPPDPTKIHRPAPLEQEPGQVPELAAMAKELAAVREAVAAAAK